MSALPRPDDNRLPAADGIEILVQMARSGQIDPWNINLSDVADKYLRAVSELRESDLKITGKTLLYLAILLRMKSDALVGIDYLNPPEEQDFLDELMEPEYLAEANAVQPKLSFKSLDEVIQRRTSTKQPRIRNVTLQDLIRELKKYEELEKQRALQEKVEKANKRRQMTDYATFTADDIEEMAHEEFLEDTILRLKNILERILIHQESVSLSELIEDGGIDRISAFLALLFLEARHEVSMHQEEFYSEVFIGPDATPPVSVAGPVAGDKPTESEEWAS